MKSIEILAGLFLPIILIVKPIWCANLIGYIFWKLNELIPYSIYGDGENSAKTFFTKRTFWFRILGIILFFLIIYDPISQNSIH